MLSTKQKNEAVQTLRELFTDDEHYRTVVEHSPHGICITDGAGNVALVNRAVERLTGYSRHELVRGGAELFYPDQHNLEHDLKELRRVGSLKREHEFRHKDGDMVPVQVRYGLVKFSDGHGEAIIEMYVDLTERRQLDVLKDEFAFVAAHELRSPVTAMRLLVELFNEDHRVQHCDISRDYLEKMNEASKRLIQLVDDLLEVSRSETGRMKIDAKPLDVAQSVYAMLEESASAALERGVEMRYLENRGLPCVLADEHKLHEILSNLLSNSIKYNKEGGSIVVGHRLDREQGKLVTWVADTGIGMDEEELTHIFHKFWRSGDVEVRAQGGTGLGLYIVKQLVERMGGEITVESEKGRGCKISFSLPIIE